MHDVLIDNTATTPHHLLDAICGGPVLDGMESRWGRTCGTPQSRSAPQCGFPQSPQQPMTLAVTRSGDARVRGTVRINSQFIRCSREDEFHESCSPRLRQRFALVEREPRTRQGQLIEDFACDFRTVPVERADRHGEELPLDVLHRMFGLPP
ncbi:hypothetical protein [Lentzea jiangxiensis]|uniref:hypothetical protein n=1 Tax=Lentzea jiangxiensis TaxID=641025 RepID=UPI00115FA03B|nr:hypothetical protein [Lentzea jiangxiensis]